MQGYRETQKVNTVVRKPNPSSQKQIGKLFKNKHMNKQMTANNRTRQAVSTENNGQASSGTNM